MFRVRVCLTNICLACLDLGVTAACYIVWLDLAGRPSTSGAVWVPLAALPVILSLWLAFSFYFGLYRSRRLDSPLADLVVLFKIGFATWIGGLAFAGLFPASGLDQALAPEFLLGNFLALTLIRSLSRVCLRELRRRGHDVRRVLLVASEELGDRLERRIRQRAHYGYRIAERLTPSGRRENGGGDLVRRVRESLRSGKIDDVILAWPLPGNEVAGELVAECEGRGVSVRIVPDLFPLIRTDTEICDLDGIPLVNAGTYPTERFAYAVFKRLFDVSASLLVLTLLSPLFLVLSILVKMTSSGPVFFTQDRIGMNGRRFRIIKFRTMRECPSLDPESHWTLDNDGFITPFGSWLRRTNLDELPQFLNVLKGEMSVVGPRPERPFFLDRFRREVPEYMARHYVKSGITGWAQVNGWRGDTAISERVAHDLYYIRNWTVGLDFRILILTLARTVLPGVPVTGRSPEVSGHD